MVPLLVLGATGRLGRMLRAVWTREPPDGLLPVWQARDGRDGHLAWDILHGPCPAGAACGVVLCLAGGRTPDPADNTRLALAALDAVRAQGGRHLFLASSAAVYAPGEGLSEDAPARPPSDYGAAKLAMERAALAAAAGGGTSGGTSGGTGITCLRIGNVVGADALVGRLRQPPGEAVIDPVPGRAGGPVRSFVGPVTLARVLARLAGLAAAGRALPQVLNLAAPRPVAMADLADAAGLAWRHGPPNPAVIPAVTFDTARLAALVPLPPAASDPAAMVAEWRSLPEAAK